MGVYDCQFRHLHCQNNVKVFIVHRFQGLPFYSIRAFLKAVQAVKLFLIVAGQGSVLNGLQGANFVKNGRFGHSLASEFIPSEPLCVRLTLEGF